LSELDRPGNLLGALALVVGDRTSAALAEAGAGGRNDTTAAALSALDQFLEDPSIDLIRQVLGLTPSGAVRLVDRLERAGYVKRRPGSDDARSVSVRLTASGRAAAARVTEARGEVLSDVLGVLEPHEREQFDALASRVLVGMIRGRGATRWMCRLCDMDACGRDAGRCPVANATGARRPSGATA
jgi:DNA-binding MarR family transcriptional regulator